MFHCLGDIFVPLVRETAGDPNFRNTCFIAVVANLRHVLQPVMQRVSEYTWIGYVTHVRSRHQYRYSEEHGGQHDAAELLGDIVHDHNGVAVGVTTTRLPCGHSTTHNKDLPMIVLELPVEAGRFTLRALRDDYFRSEALQELRCNECFEACVEPYENLLGCCKRTFKESLAGKVSFRINRYSLQGKQAASSVRFGSVPK